jgi:hypothetical protein
VGGSAPPFEDALLFVVEAPVSVEVCSDLGSHPPLGGGVDLTAALRELAMDFLMKLRVEVDRVICFGLGFKIKATRDLRKRMGWIFSRLGLKPKLQFGFSLRGRCKPKPLDGSRVKAIAGVVRRPASISG